MSHACGLALSWLCAAASLASAVETAERLDADWARLQEKRPSMGARELFGFALEAAAAHWHPEHVAAALALAEEMQDRDPESRAYGNFRWYWRAEKVEDWNAVEFCMQQGALLWMHHKDGLDAEGVERLDRLIRFSIEGIRRHRVGEGYTNIFLMKTWNCIALGEAAGRPGLADEGYQMLDRWLFFTWDHGVQEYVSPTYYGTDLDSLGLIAKFAKRPEGRKAAEAALRLFWTDIAANWFEPCGRLGGAHSRDYDYLTGHGYLDLHLRAAGWLKDREPPSSAFFEACKWLPPKELRSTVESQCPRLVLQRWGAEPWKQATNYVGRRFCIGSAGASYEPTDKTLTVNLAGGPKMPVVSFLMDARGDPYGKKRFVTGGGHQKALHLMPFLASVQRGPEVLLLASVDPASRLFQRWAPEPTCLLSHLVLPANAGVWLGDTPVKPPDASTQVPIPQGSAAFLRFEDVAVGVRFVLATDGAGKAAPVCLANDGGSYGAMRLTCTHSPTAPTGRGTVALWVRAAEGLDEAAFAAFRRAFAAARAAVKADGGRIEVAVPGEKGSLRLAVDVTTEQRIACDGAEPGSEGCLLAVNGRDLGREILGDAEPIASYRRLLAAAERGDGAAAKAEQVFEAEAAAVVVPPFRADADADASGGRFLWVPGEPGGKGGSGTARALWLVHVPKAGDYYLWGRVQTPTPDDDSFFVGVRQGGREVLPRSDWHTGVHGKWEWAAVTAGAERRPLTLRLEAGAALLEVWCREDGARLDALVLTAEPGARPGEGARR